MSEKEANVDSTEDTNAQPDSDEAVTQLTADAFFKSPDFYSNAQKYWSSIEPTIDGMLGGLSMIDSTDVNASKQFLNDLFKMKPSPKSQRALDCGAGIGRITKNVLANYFECVDLVEQDENFARKASEYLGAANPRIGTMFNVGLQDFDPTESTYDVIWCQWVLGHLTDDDLSNFFKRCSTALTKNGCIVIKENFTSSDDFCIDANDSSVTRSLRITKNILESVNLRIIKMVKQSNFIQGLFPVYTIACRPMRTIQ